jgi:hypothetical protein
VNKSGFLLNLVLLSQLYSWNRFFSIIIIIILIIKNNHWLLLKLVDREVSMLLSQGCYAVKIWLGDIDLWPITLKINRVPDSHKDYICTKFGQNPLKDLDSRVFTRMLCGEQGLIFRRGDTPRFALPLLFFKSLNIMSNISFQTSM